MHKVQLSAIAAALACHAACTLEAMPLRTMSAPAHNVISINVSQDGVSGQQVDANEMPVSSFAGELPGSAWVNINHLPNGYRNVISVAWNASAQGIVDKQDVGLALNAGNVANYCYDTVAGGSNVYLPAYMRAFCARKDRTSSNAQTSTVDGIPYESYTVVFYVSGLTNAKDGKVDVSRSGDDETNYLFDPITFNETTYYYVSDGDGGWTLAQVPDGSNGCWGDCRAAKDGTLAEGVNLMIFHGVTGTSFTFANRCWAAGIAAIQIIDEGNYQYTEVEIPDGDRPTRDTICLNVCQSESSVGHIGATHNPIETLNGWLPGAAWNCLDRTPGSNQSPRNYPNYWKTDPLLEGGGVVTNDGPLTVKVESGNMNNSNYGYDIFNNTVNTDEFTPDFLRMWMARRDVNMSSDATITLDQIPFLSYKVYVYVSGVSNSVRSAEGKFDPIRVNGTWYYWDDANGRVASGGDSDCWGNWEASKTGPVLGQNVLLFENCMGSSIEIYGRCYAAGVAAIEIVDDSPPAGEPISVNVEADQTLTLSGDQLAAYGTISKTGGGTLVVTGTLTNQVVLAAGTFEYAAMGEGGSVSCTEGTMLVVPEDPLADGAFSVAYTGTSAVKVRLANGTLADPLTLQAGNGVLSGTFRPAVDGTACLYDFTFDGTLESRGSVPGRSMAVDDDSSMGTDLANQFKDGKALYVAAHPGTSNCDPALETRSWTAVVYGTVPRQAKAIFASFGERTGAMVISKGEGTDEVVLSREDNSEHTPYCDPVRVQVIQAADKPHLYVVRRVFTEELRDNVEFWVDGRLRGTYRYTPDENTTQNHQRMTLGAGLRIGGIRFGVGDVHNVLGLKHYCHSSCTSGTGFDLDASQMQDSVVDTLRFYDRALGPNAMAALLEELSPYVSGVRIIIR